MKMILVWVLLVQPHPHSKWTSSFIVDNIATEAECARLQKLMVGDTTLSGDRPGTFSRCYAVQKAVPA